MSLGDIIPHAINLILQLTHKNIQISSQHFQVGFANFASLFQNMAQVQKISFINSEYTLIFFLKFILLFKSKYGECITDPQFQEKAMLEKTNIEILNLLEVVIEHTAQVEGKEEKQSILALLIFISHIFEPFVGHKTEPNGKIPFILANCIENLMRKKNESYMGEEYSESSSKHIGNLIYLYLQLISLFLNLHIHKTVYANIIHFVNKRLSYDGNEFEKGLLGKGIVLAIKEESIPKMEDVFNSNKELARLLSLENVVNLLCSQSGYEIEILFNTMLNMSELKQLQYSTDENKFNKYEYYFSVLVNSLYPTPQNQSTDQDGLSFMNINALWIETQRILKFYLAIANKNNKTETETRRLFLSAGILDVYLTLFDFNLQNILSRLSDPNLKKTEEEKMKDKDEEFSDSNLLKVQFFQDLINGIQDLEGSLTNLIRDYLRTSLSLQGIPEEDCDSKAKLILNLLSLTENEEEQAKCGDFPDTKCRELDKLLQIFTKDPLSSISSFKHQESLKKLRKISRANTATTELHKEILDTLSFHFLSPTLKLKSPLKNFHLPSIPPLNALLHQIFSAIFILSLISKVLSNLISLIQSSMQLPFVHPYLVTNINLAAKSYFKFIHVPLSYAFRDWVVNNHDLSYPFGASSPSQLEISGDDDNEMDALKVKEQGALYANTLLLVQLRNAEHALRYVVDQFQTDQPMFMTNLLHALVKKIVAKIKCFRAYHPFFGILQKEDELYFANQNKLYIEYSDFDKEAFLNLLLDVLLLENAVDSERKLEENKDKSVLLQISTLLLDSLKIAEEEWKWKEGEVILGEIKNRLLSLPQQKLINLLKISVLEVYNPSKVPSKQETPHLFKFLEAIIDFPSPEGSESPRDSPNTEQTPNLKFQIFEAGMKILESLTITPLNTNLSGIPSQSAPSTSSILSLTLKTQLYSAPPPALLHHTLTLLFPIISSNQDLLEPSLITVHKILKECDLFTQRTSREGIGADLLSPLLHFLFSIYTFALHKQIEDQHKHSIHELTPGGRIKNKSSKSKKSLNNQLKQWDSSNETLSDFANSIEGYGVSEYVQDNALKHKLESKALPKHCTFLQTGSKYFNQHWYYCYTCALVNNKGCCTLCAFTCHQGHHVFFCALWFFIFAFF